MKRQPNWYAALCGENYWNQREPQLSRLEAFAIGYDTEAATYYAEVEPQVLFRDVLIQTGREHKQWPPPGWKRGGLAGMSSTEARRDEILSLKPKCADCEVPFRPGYEPPRDGLCRLCREERNKPPPDDPALF